MKIKSIKALSAKFPSPISDNPVRDSWRWVDHVATPMSRYPRFKREGLLWAPPWEETSVCVVTAEDGTFGVGMTVFSTPVNSLINDHFAPLLVGENCMAIEKIWDMMFRLASPYSAAGIGRYAITAVDLTLWDLKAKLAKMPVYELLGGPARDEITCYATGSQTEWHMELGFKASKLTCLAGPSDGSDALEKNEELISRNRELTGPNVELMLDCWMALDLEFTVRLAERLRPYNLKWIEDCLIPEDYDGFRELKNRLPWQSIATGEHWYTSLPFLSAVSDRSVDYLQPDIQWVGGMTALVKICHIAEAAGISVIPHGGASTSYGQHACYAMPTIPLGEYFMQTPPGMPLDHFDRSGTEAAGVSVPKDGNVIPNDAPGFGIELTMDDIEKVTA